MLSERERGRALDHLRYMRNSLKFFNGSKSDWSIFSNSCSALTRYMQRKND